MAVIHKSRSDLRRRKRAAGFLMLLCWPLAIVSAALTVCFYLDCGGALLLTANTWRTQFVAWAFVPQPGYAHAWMAQIERLWLYLLRGTAWGIYGLTLAAPALLGAGVTVLLARLHRPSAARHRSLRARARAERTALTLLRQLPDVCHLFLNRRLVFEGGTSEMDVIIVGPGGAAVVGLMNWSGLIEGCVTEPVLYRKRQDGAVDKLRNPARQVVGHAARLSAYLRSVDVNAAIVPVVLFVNPEASVYVRPPEEMIVSGRRSRLSSCVMADTSSFWELLGRGLAGGQQLSRSAVERMVMAVSKAPQGRREQG